MEIEAIKKRVRPICEHAGIEMLGVFGSVARGQDTPESDIDMIVRFREPVGLIEFIDVENEIESALGRHIDLGTEASVHPLIRKNVFRDLKIVYEG
jgi:predicted nucleotidyltransferase